MKNLKKCGLLLSALLLLGTGRQVYAEEITGSQEWSVAFNGNELVSNLGSIAEAVNQMQPGDSVTFTVDVRNDYAEDTDFWMYNAVLKSFEDNSPANGGAYEYLLSYNDEEIFNSDTVGGEETAGGREGLKEATGSLEDYFYLDTLSQGETGKVTLVISLDGETQGNVYQNTLANVDLRFAAEVVTQVPTPAAPTPNRTPAVKTGDNTAILPWLIACGVSGLALMVIVLLLSDKRGKGERHA